MLNSPIKNTLLWFFPPLIYYLLFIRSYLNIFILFEYELKIL